MDTKDKNIFDIFKSNKEKELKKDKNELEGKSDTEVEEEVVEEIPDNNKTKGKSDLESYSPYIIIMLIVIIIIKLRSKLKK